VRKPWPEDARRFAEEVVIPLRLACAVETGWPLVLSLWYVFEEDSLWCATRQGARLVSYLSGNRRCGWEIASDAMPYCGLRGQAEALIVPERGPEILERLLLRYLGTLEAPLARRLRGRAEPEVAIHLQPVSLTAWNYAPRMQGTSGAQTAARPCPDGPLRLGLT